VDTAYVICGKLGDVLSGVMIAQAQSSQVNIVTSEQYAPVIEGLPGVAVHIYEGKWHDLKGAIKFAKSRFKKVLIPQTFGEDFPIKHTRPSFQLDQAARCDFEGFDQVRLKLPRPENAHEIVAKHLSGDKNILIADHSQSSPFEPIGELINLVQERFPSHQITRLSQVKLGHFRDFLPLYDAADVLITIDTSHLHLSSATNTPVFALACDKPNRWRGSAWHSRFAFYCRYGDYPARKEQMMHELELTLARKHDPEIQIVKTEHPFAYNPSIIEWKGRVVRSYRFNPDVALWPTTIAIDDKPVILPDRLKNCSVEDGRLFIFKGKLHLSYNYTPYPVKGPAICAIAYGELVNEGGVWRLINHSQPNYGKNNLTALEKNWVFFDYQGTLHAIYQCSPEQIVLELDGERVMREHRTTSPKFSMGTIRGGTQPILYNGSWLRFFHTLVRNPKQEMFWHYHMAALLMDPKPPFGITAVSKFPILSGDERYFHNWKFWKARCVLPYGAVQHGDGWRVSVGINDSACADVIVKPDQLGI
jgi:predicted GH43/DUF377 family glycosyl hydrolase